MTGTTDRDAAVAIRNAIDHIEEAYEFMLAYAAQGRKRESDGEGVSKIRGYLDRMSGALDILAKVAASPFADDDEAAPFRDRFLGDIAVMRSVIGLLRAQPSISSEMVDNTNGLIAVRTFLTDLFFIDQVVLPPR